MQDSIFFLQKINMAKGQYEKWITEEGQTLLRGWKRQGLTDEQIAKKIGVNARTIWDWKTKYPQISRALKKGKEICDFEAEEALLGLFQGHFVEEQVMDQWEEGKGDNTKITKRHIHKTKRWVEPNPTAIIFYLKSRAGWKEQWQKESLEQKKAEFEYQKEKDSGQINEIEDLSELEEDIYENPEEKKDDSV